MFRMLKGDDVAASDLAQDVFHRDLDVIKIDRGGGAALQSHLFSSAPGDTPSQARSTRNAVNFFAADLGKVTVYRSCQYRRW